MRISYLNKTSAALAVVSVALLGLPGVAFAGVGDRRSRTSRRSWFAACARGCGWRTLACAQVQQPWPAVRRSTATDHR